MKTNNNITKLLRILIYIWWYCTIAGGVILGTVFIGTQLGGWNLMNSLNFGIEWEIEDVVADDELLITVSDHSGKSYQVDELAGIGVLSFKVDEGLGKLAFPFLVTSIFAFSIALWGTYQLRKLFDNFAKGNYFEVENSIRVKRIAYAIFAFISLQLLIQIIFESVFIVKTGSNISVDGIEIGIKPLFIAALFLLALSRVFKEATTIKAEQDLTV